MFLVFEGLDGSGKSTLMKMLHQKLMLMLIEVVITREPGGTDLGDQLRELILKKNENIMPPCARAELLMYQASRAQHVDLIIEPALRQNKWVLCDRFTASSVAFQGGGRQISLKQVQWLNDFATNELKPDLTILLDLSVADSKLRRLNRASQTGEVDDRIESEKDEFHERVRNGFIVQAQAEANKWLVLDASESPELLFLKLIKEIENRHGFKNHLPKDNL